MDFPFYVDNRYFSQSRQEEGARIMEELRKNREEATKKYEEEMADLQPVANKHPSIHGKAEIAWDDAHFGKIPTWYINPLDDNQALLMGREWMNEVTNGPISSRTAIRGLKLALSIKSMNPGDRKYLLSQQQRGLEATDLLLARVNLPEMTSFSATPFTLRNQQMIGNMAVDATKMEEAAKIDNDQIPAGNDDEQQEKDASCFAALFLMRLLVKSPVNIVNALKNMRMRHESFYGPSRIMSRFTLSIARAAAYKEALVGLDLISLTYTHALAYTHQYMINTMTPQEVGVLSYLGFLPFAYSGLHSYTLMIELKNLTKVGLDKLLALFYCDITAPALLKMAQLINNFEVTDVDPDRSVLFRYCSLWSPQYFSMLRSKNSSHLLYTIACAWKTLNQGDENADPENIAAVAKISAPMKQTLKRAGTIIGESLKRSMLGGHGASAAFEMALTAQTAPIPQQIDEGVNFDNM